MNMGRPYTLIISMRCLPLGGGWRKFIYSPLPPPGWAHRRYSMFKLFLQDLKESIGPVFGMTILLIVAVGLMFLCQYA